MAEALAHVVSKTTKSILKQASFISISVDEVTTIDHEWLSVHAYLCLKGKWSQESMVVMFVRLMERNNFQAVKEAILTTLTWHSGLNEQDIVEKVVCFRADGVSIFQGCSAGIITLLQKEECPYMFGVHCFAHRTNLVVEPLSNLPIVEKCEPLCRSMYAYFSLSPKKHLEFQKLADVVEIKGLNMLRHVKTCWSLVLEPLKRIMGEYKTLICKMAEDAAVKDPHLSKKQRPSREIARHNLDLLCDVGTLFTLPCLLPLLEFVNSLMKFAQATDVFICDYVAAMKICQAELYMIYHDVDTSFQQQHFPMFVDAVNNHSYTIT
jgi:hypothetical protein